MVTIIIWETICLYFRYPNDEMLMMGNVFTTREFEIIRLIEFGLSSEEIAEKLFLSPHTVNTHRRNILKKTRKPYISELIYDEGAGFDLIGVELLIARESIEKLHLIPQSFI